MAHSKKFKQAFLIVGFVWSLIFAFSPAGILVAIPVLAQDDIEPIKYQSQIPFIILDPKNPESVAEWEAAKQRDFIYYNEQTKKKGSDMLARYLKVVYDYGIFIAALLAAVVFMAGGLIWLSSGGNESKITQAKTMIFSSLTGVIIISGSWVLLNTINPDLLNMKVIYAPAIVAKNLESTKPQEDIALETRTQACKDENNNSKSVGEDCKMGDTPGYCAEAYNSQGDELLTACQPCLKTSNTCNEDYECANILGECGNNAPENDCYKKIVGDLGPLEKATVFMMVPMVKCHTKLDLVDLQGRNYFAYIDCRCK